MKKPKNINAIMLKITDAIELQFSDYTWEDMIDDCGPTKAEAKWAKANLCYTVKEVGL